ncbi:DNA-directed RNA polymerase sigma-70 factor [Actinorhabdospora filicis]|uniref:DNA-directed RNA polymerase sigma-70 factor n=1 Tax=Actinorhabdospora filicis TaxID=1785913 RepID=A0A9W6SHJ9_9ACTN|nr:sigma-70 family RNA polymerase sigma factor [Actinorhabdospora filicis]GLZ76092.1 DNA-directed RNA polymerase sigma-70 factor [Actinorhabdospora filicis]
MTYVSRSVDMDMQRRAEALRRAQAGDRKALDELIADLSPLLWRVVRGQGVDRASAEDVVQMTWLKFWSSLGDIKTPEAVVGWLATVAKREASKLWRSGSKEEPVEPDWAKDIVEESDIDDEVLDRVNSDERRRVLWAAVTELDDRCQQLIQVIAYADRPDYEQIARALGMPRGSIGPTRGRCLGKLRKRLSADPAWTDRVELS